MNKDLYALLGVDRSASPEEIKNAHRRGVKRHHPDKNKGKRSEEFLAVQKAYDVLSNDESRKRYDETGQTEKPKFTIESEIAALFSGVIDAGASPDMDLLEAAKQAVMDGIQNLEKSKANLEKNARNYRKVASRLKYKKNKLVHEILEDKARNADSLAEKIPERIRFGQLLLKTLDDLEYESAEVEISVRKNSKEFDFDSTIMKMMEEAMRSR